MDIRNATQFANFVNAAGLSGLDPVFRQVIICIGDYLNHCNCHDRGNKEVIYRNCNTLYVQGARLAASRFKNDFLSKTTDRQIGIYQDNGQLLFIISR